ncbi:hypothetical protein ACW2Q0_13565 [Nocardia sp. R16R-3T]
MNRIAISITMLIPPLFLLSLALAQPVSAAPPDSAAPPWGHMAILGSEVVFAECTGSACSAPHAGDRAAHMPDPLRAASFAVAPGVLSVNIAPEGLRMNLAPDAARVTSGALSVNVAPDAPPVDVAPDAPHAEFAPDMFRVDGAVDIRSTDSGRIPIFEEGTVPLTTSIMRGDGAGSASSLPRVVGDLLSRLLDLVRRVPLPLPR